MLSRPQQGRIYFFFWRGKGRRILFFWRNLAMFSFGDLSPVNEKTRGICQTALDLMFWCVCGNFLGTWDPVAQPLWRSASSLSRSAF